MLFDHGVRILSNSFSLLACPQALDQHPRIIKFILREADEFD